jgi:two-component system response regulator HydG
VPLPPLRERGVDVLLLAQRFLEQAAALCDKKVTGLSSDVAERLMAWPWPGNVRELHNCIERAVALTTEETLCVRDLPERLRQPRASLPGLGLDTGGFLPLAEVEKRHILAVLEALGGNKSSAATVLGLDRRTLYRKLAEYRAEGASPDDAPDRQGRSR